MSREREISGSEAVRLYTERMRERQDGPTAALRRNMQEADERIAAAERECDQLRALLRQVGDWAVDPTDNPYMRLHQIAGLITASGLLDDEGQQP